MSKFIFLCFIAVIAQVWSPQCLAIANFEDIQGVELLIADSSDSQIESMFGHSLLRFVSKSGDSFNDLVLSFEAVIPSNLGQSEKNFRGITGTLGSRIAKVQLIDVLSGYSLKENRGFSRYILRLHDLQIHRLFELANNLEELNKQIPNYSFFNNNCSRLLTWFFSLADIQLTTNALIPTQLPITFQLSLLSPWSRIETPSGSKILRNVSHSGYGKEEIQIQERELNKISAEEAFILLTGAYKFSEVTRNRLKILIRGQDFDVESLYNIKRKNIIFYRSQLPLVPDFEHLCSQVKLNFFIPYLQLEQTVKALSDWSEQKNILKKIRNEERNKTLLICKSIM